MPSENLWAHAKLVQLSEELQYQPAEKPPTLALWVYNWFNSSFDGRCQSVLPLFVKANAIPAAYVFVASLPAVVRRAWTWFVFDIPMPIAVAAVREAA